jgi:hypothetical protein
MTVFLTSITCAANRNRSLIQQLLIRSLLITIFAAGVTVTTASAVTVTLEWDANPQPEQRGYKIFCRLSTDETYDYEKPVWAGTDGSCDITGLAPGTDYCFVVRAFDADGNESGDSNEVFYPGSQIDQEEDGETEAEEESESDAESGSRSGSDAEQVLDTPEPNSMPENGANTDLTPVLENVSDSDNAGQGGHTETQWQVFQDDGTQSPLCVYDVQSSEALEVLQLPPLVLDEETPYYWRSRYLDSSGTSGDWAAAEHFTTGVLAEDADGDGILDDQEVMPDADLNADGIADDTQLKLRGVYTAPGEGSVAVDALSDDRVLAIAGVQSLDPAELTDGDGYDLPLGLVTFKLTLADGARQASVTLHLSHAPSDDMVLLTFDAVRGWQSMAELAQLADDGASTQLSLTDGGSEDVDGIENGIIIFSGGYGRPVDYHFTNAVTSGTRGSAEVMGVASACFIGSAGF